MKTAVQVTMYLTESDKWEKVLQTLRREGVAGASAFHAAAGFLGRNTVHTAGLVEAGGNVPVIADRHFADHRKGLQIAGHRGNCSNDGCADPSGWRFPITLRREPLGITRPFAAGSCRPLLCCPQNLKSPACS